LQAVLRTFAQQRQQGVADAQRFIQVVSILGMLLKDPMSVYPLLRTDHSGPVPNHRERGGYYLLHGTLTAGTVAQTDLRPVEPVAVRDVGMNCRSSATSGLIGLSERISIPVIIWTESMPPANFADERSVVFGRPVPLDSTVRSCGRPQRTSHPRGQ
jgi:hypothetical protein